MQYEKRQKLKNVLRYLWMAMMLLFTVYTAYFVFRFYCGVRISDPRIPFFVIAPMGLGNVAWLNMDRDFIDGLPVPGLQCAPHVDQRFRVTVSDVYGVVTAAAMIFYLYCAC